MDNLKKQQIALINPIKPALFSKKTTSNKRQLGYFNHKSRVAILPPDSTLVKALQRAPDQSINGKAAFELINWLVDKPRLSGESRQSYLLSTVDLSRFSGFDFHPTQNLFVDSFDSPHTWEDGDSRAQEQLADLLLPSGQWHRHYDTVILSTNANDKQVELIRHWLELTNGSVLIIEDEQEKWSIHVQQLIAEITPIEIETLNHTKLNQKKSQSGISVTCYDTNNHKNTYTLQNIIDSATHLPNQSPATRWVYEGKIRVPQAGYTVFLIDFVKLENVLTLEINQQTITIDPIKGYDEIAFSHLEEGEQVNVKITTTTSGMPPELRLHWGLANTNTLDPIPNHAFSHMTSSSKVTQTQPVFNPYGFRQIISLPPQSVNAIKLTDELLHNSEYFSLTIDHAEQKEAIKLTDIPLRLPHSWEALAQQIEQKTNAQQGQHSLAKIKVKYHHNQLTISGDGLTFSQFQLKQLQPIHDVSLFEQVETQKQANQTTHQISISPNEFNNLTHLTLELTHQQGHSIKLSNSLFKSLETRFHSPKQFAQHLHHHLQTRLNETSISVTWDEQKNCLNVTDSQNRTLEKLQFSYQHQILPIAVAENPNKLPNQLTLGAIKGKLPTDSRIAEYQLIEKPLFGEVVLNHKVGNWQYLPDKQHAFQGSEQFDFIAIMNDGRVSAPMSIQLQSQNAPLLSIPGKKTFAILDPIYHPPELHNHPQPDDLKVDNIQLAQTHLQSPNAPYFHLTADRWALIKVGITSQSGAKAPDIVAIVSDSQGQEVARIILTGPEKLPQTSLLMPNIPSVAGSEWHKQSYTAPLKSAWIQPGNQLQIMVGNQPIILPYTDADGRFSLKVNPSNPMNSHITNTSLYLQGHGVYAYSPLSWGLEALAKLPTQQFTVHSYPAVAQSPYLTAYDHSDSHGDTLLAPQYDSLRYFNHFGNAQINWAYQNSRKSAGRSGKKSAFHYSNVHPFQPPSVELTTLGLAASHYGGGWTKPSTLWHEIYGHGLGLPHTSAASYPYNHQSNGPSMAYDQHTQRYTTYRYTESETVHEIKPALYPYHTERINNKNEAFLAHSDYFTAKAQQFLSQKLRWQPNAIIGFDTEDHGFAGEGFYQWWSTEKRQWITLNQDNYQQYDRYLEPHSLTYRREVAIYALNGKLLTLPDGTLHPYSHLNVTRTIGDLIAPSHNLVTQTGQPSASHTPLALTVTYATNQGLLTETIQIPNSGNEISFNIADKGEIVTIDINDINAAKNFDQLLYRYVNPDSLVNRLFSPQDRQILAPRLQLDNYWRGSKLFWSATDKELVNFSTGEVNLAQINQNSALYASWIENGQLRQQYFPLHHPFMHHRQVNLQQTFHAINHLEIQQDRSTNISPHLEVVSENLLLSDVHIKQIIDITSMNLSDENNHYWLTLLTKDSEGRIIEQAPLEAWYLSLNQNILTINGTLSSTPGLNIMAIKVYIDRHLHDEVPANTLIIYQDRDQPLVENSAMLDYNRPVMFNSIAHLPELISSIKETEAALAHPHVLLPSESGMMATPLAA